MEGNCREVEREQSEGRLLTHWIEEFFVLLEQPEDMKDVMIPAFCKIYHYLGMVYYCSCFLSVVRLVRGISSFRKFVFSSSFCQVFVYAVLGDFRSSSKTPLTYIAHNQRFQNLSYMKYRLSLGRISTASFNIIFSFGVVIVIPVYEPSL